MQWIERQRYFVDYVLSSMWRHKARNAALTAVYALVVFLVASVVFFTGALRREADLLLAEAPELVVQRMVAGRNTLVPESYAEAVRDIRGVGRVTPRLWGYYFHPAAGANYTLMAPGNFAHGDDAAEIGSGVRRTWRSIREERLFLRGADGQAVTLKIAGVLPAETELAAADLILVSETTFRRILGVPAGFANDLSVKVRNPREAGTIAEKISQTLPDARPILREEIRRTYAALFDWRSGYVIVLLGGAVLAFLIFAWDKATGLSAAERMEIGVLKAVGWDTADVLMAKFWEGVVISLSAFLTGVIAAYIHVFFGSASLFEHALKGWAVLYPQFRLYPQVDPFNLAVLFFLAVVPYTFITIVPAWRAAIADPDSAMRAA